MLARRLYTHFRIALRASAVGTVLRLLLALKVLAHFRLDPFRDPLMHWGRLRNEICHRGQSPDAVIQPASKYVLPHLTQGYQFALKVLEIMNERRRIGQYN